LMCEGGCIYLSTMSRGARTFKVYRKIIIDLVNLKL